MTIKKQHYSAFQFSNEKLKNEKNFMQKAVKINGLSLEFASEEMKENEEIVI
jgi:hypothetical protein